MKISLKYKTPQNCEALNVIKVKDEIFKTVRKETRKKDIVLQRIETDMSKGLSALTNVFDKITDPTASETLCDAISLFSNALHDTNVFRRSAFKPDFKKEYAGLCAESKPIKDTLFKEVSEEAKAIAETSKITNKITKKVFHPYKRQQPFLGQGGLPSRKAGNFQGRPYNNHSRNFTNFNKNFNKTQTYKHTKESKKEGRR